jgi:hypothetical protein
VAYGRQVWHWPGFFEIANATYGFGYSNALGRTITYQDIPVEPWRHALLERRWPVHVVNHLAVMADLHRAGRFDRMSDEVLMLTGERPLSVQEFVRKNAATFTTQAPRPALTSSRTP